MPPPTKPSEAPQDRIKVQNILREAQATLVDHWLPKSDADRLLSPVAELSETTEFVSDRRHGVAIYLADGFLAVFAVTEPVAEQWVLDKRFVLRPMLAELEGVGSFFMLSLSKKRVGLFAATADSIEEVTPAALPAGLEASLRAVTVDRGAQVHSGTTGLPGKEAGVFHGQGGKPDTEKSELHDHLVRVDHAVSSALQNRGNPPLVLAGVEYLTAMYHNVSDYPQLVDDAVVGNVDHLSAQQLLTKATPIASAERCRQRDCEATRIREHECPMASDPEQVLVAATQGKVDVLFFDRNAELFGSFYADTRTLKELHRRPQGDPADPNRDLIELAVVETLNHNGRVFSVDTDDMPVPAKMAACLRF